MASIAPSITPEIKRALDQIFAHLEQEAEASHSEKRRRLQEAMGRDDTCHVRSGDTSEAGAPFVNIRDNYPHLRQLAKDIDDLLMGTTGESQQQPCPASAPVRFERQLPRHHDLPSSFRQGGHWNKKSSHRFSRSRRRSRDSSHRRHQSPTPVENVAQLTTLAPRGVNPADVMPAIKPGQFFRTENVLPCSRPPAPTFSQRFLGASASISTLAAERGEQLRQGTSGVPCVAADISATLEVSRPSASSAA